MADREKLIELLFVGQVLADAECDKQAECNKCQYSAPNACRVGFIADHLIANGVTIQRWIPVTERLPQEDEPLGATCEQVQVLLADGTVTTGWCNRFRKLWYHLPWGDTHFYAYPYEHTPVIAWQPLAEPPKGE